jgi:hypothetical protein
MYIWGDCQLPNSRDINGEDHSKIDNTIEKVRRVNPEVLNCHTNSSSSSPTRIVKTRLTTSSHMLYSLVFTHLRTTHLRLVPSQSSAKVLFCSFSKSPSTECQGCWKSSNIFQKAHFDTVIELLQVTWFVVHKTGHAFMG